MQGVKVLTDENKALMKKLREKGMSYTTIATKVHISWQIVTEYLKSEGYGNLKNNVPKKEYTVEEMAYMRELREQGDSYTEIAKKVHSSETTVKRYLESVGYKPRRKSTKPLTDEEKETILFMYQDCHISIFNIHKELGISENRIRKYLVENDIELMSRFDGIDTMMEKRYSVDMRRFDDFERDEFIKELNRKNEG